MLMNKKWTAIVLGITLMATGIMATDQGHRISYGDNIEVQRALTRADMDQNWSEMLEDFQQIIELDEEGSMDEAIDLWEELIPQVDSQLGIVFDDSWMPDDEGMDEEDEAGGWTGYINTFSGLIDDQYIFDELIEFAEDIDSLTETSPMVDRLESQISILLNEALASVDLTEVEGIFLEPSELEGYLSDVELETYSKLLDIYMNDEENGNFESAQDSYEELIDLLNQYPELSDENEGQLFAQFKVINEKLTLIENPVDEYGEALNVQSASKDELEKYQLLWNYVIKLMPDSATDYVDKFEVGTDGRDGTMAFVYPTSESGKKFVLNLDVNDMIGPDGKYMKKDMDETIVHEFGHVLTLNNTQLTSSATGTYQTQEGILRQESYMNKFHGAYWKGKTDKYLLSNEDGYRQYDVEMLYGDHASWFVSDYAATNVEEDIAESFRMFVLEDKARGNDIADQKINFFYQFPELVEMRDEIRLSQ